MRFGRILAAVAALALVVSACGTTAHRDAGSGGPQITVTDKLGKHTLDGSATRVVALEWDLVEYLLDVGVTPVGVADVEGYNTWVSAQPVPTSVKDVGLRQEASVESIAGLDPDLILTETNCGKIDQFKKIADTLCYPGTDPDGNFAYMRDAFTQVAKAVGKEKRAEQVLDDLDVTIAQGKEKLAAAGMGGQKFAGAHGWTGKGAPVIRLWGRNSLASDVAERVGLRNAWKGKTDEWGLTTTDVEGLTKLGDVEFLYVAPEDNVFETTLPDNRIWRNLPFVKHHNVHKLDGGTWLFGGPASTSQFVDELVHVLTSK
ncbi:MAG: ABC transporter substrate-binding protein [Streptosporangiales bacterium]